MSQFVESLKRLYDSNMINMNKVVELFENGKITEKDKTYILGQ